MNKIEVLDKGFVALLDHMGDDTTIVNAARVSFGKRIDKMTEKDEKLIRYLLEHRHTSPFEHVQFQFHIKCPLFVRSQWHRHRTWSYNEISSRYTELPEEYYVPEYFRPQAEHDKQASKDEPIDNPEIRDLYTAVIGSSFSVYRRLLELGVSREMARMVLPQATYTEFYGTVDLHNLLHFIELRIDSHAQWEIRQYARALLELITPIVPVTVKHWKELKNIET